MSVARPGAGSRARRSGRLHSPHRARRSARSSRQPTSRASRRSAVARSRAPASWPRWAAGSTRQSPSSRKRSTSCSRAGERAEAARAEVTLGELHLVTNRIEEGVELLERALAAHESEGDERAIASVSVELGQAPVLRGAARRGNPARRARTRDLGAPTAAGRRRPGADQQGAADPAPPEREPRPDAPGSRCSRRRRATSAERCGRA